MFYNLNRKPSDEKISKEEIFRLRNEGLSYDKIAEKLGCSKSYVAKVLRNYSTNKKKKLLEDNVTTYYMTKEEIEKRYGAVGCFKEDRRI